jgi:hypothetical protein
MRMPSRDKNDVGTKSKLVQPWAGLTIFDLFLFGSSFDLSPERLCPGSRVLEN